MEFNAKKCHDMEIGERKMMPTWNYKMSNEKIGKVMEEKGLGEIIWDSLSLRRPVVGTVPLIR